MRPLTARAPAAASRVSCNRRTNRQTNKRTEGHRHHVMPLLLQRKLNPLIATLKLQSSGPSYSNTVIGTQAVDGWAVTFGNLVQRGGDWAGRSPPRPLLAVPNVTAHPLTARVPTSYYSMWHYNCLWSLKVSWHIEQNCRR